MKRWISWRRSISSSSIARPGRGYWEMDALNERALPRPDGKHEEPRRPVELVSRRTLLQRAGLGLGTVLVAGSGALGYRAYDQGVLEVGQGPAYAPWSSWRE